MSGLVTKQKLQFGLSLLIILILFGCSKSPGSPENNVDISLAAMDAYIDPEIPENEKLIMREILSVLPESARQDVIHVDDSGNSYTNRTANKGDLKVLRQTSKGDWVDQNGRPYPKGIPSMASASRDVIPANNLGH